MQNPKGFWIEISKYGGWNHESEPKSVDGEE